MGRRLSANSIEIIPGLRLKPQPNCSTFQAHAHIEKHTYRAGTGSSDVAVASEWALAWYWRIKLAIKNGDNVKRRCGWDRLISEYKKTLTGGAKEIYHTETIQRHFDPYFKDYRDIALIDNRALSQYLIHRRTKKKPEPTPQTLNRENTVLRQLFRFAVDQGWMRAIPNISAISEHMTRRRRRHFTDEEYELLIATARRRIRQARTVGGPFNPAVYESRLLLYDVIQILAHSGLRVDELRTVHWRSIDWHLGDIALETAGKRRSNRRLILRRPAIRALLRLKARRLKWLNKQGYSPLLDPNEKIMSYQCGAYIRDVKVAFNGLLRACGFRYRTAKDKHALTSLRHTYATRALKRTASKRPSTHVLALQMGTSERMIRAHYGHDSVEDYRDELRG